MTRLALTACLSLIVLIACAAPPPPSGEGRPLPAPTVASIFRELPPVPTAALWETPPTPAPPLVSSRARANNRDTMSDRVAIVSVYSDGLGTDWTLANSQGMAYEIGHAGYAFESTTSIAVTPKAPEGTLLFSLHDQSKIFLDRDEVLGVRFQLSGGSKYVSFDSLLVAIVGSNGYTYWVPNDNTVSDGEPVTKENPLFPQYRLYFLDINQDIPPYTWVDVTLDLVKEHQPDYDYVTGLYIRNDKEFFDTFYVDDVQILLRRDGR
jgi:hypothetical protein